MIGPSSRLTKVAGALAGLIMVNSAWCSDFQNSKSAIDAPSTNQEQGLTAAAKRTERLIRAYYSMKVENEARPHGVPREIGWVTRPNVGMGTNPTVSGIPTFWKGPRIQEWRGFLPWFVAFEEEIGNPAKNAVVEVNGIEAWVLRKSTSKWELIESDSAPHWFATYPENNLDKPTTKLNLGKTEAGSGWFAPGQGFAVHGGLRRVLTPWTAAGPDIQALYVSVRHRLRLATPSGPDELDIARYCVQVGADYYPCTTDECRSQLNGYYIPSAGVGRIMRSERNWRRSEMFVGDKSLSPKDLEEIPPPEFRY